MSNAAIPVAVSGVSLGTMLLGLLNAIGFGGVIIALIRRKTQTEQIANAREANLLTERAKEMESMRERIAKLEGVQEAKDTSHSEEVEALKRRAEAKTRLHEAERAADRHRINNLNQAFQALLLLLKKGVSVEDAVAEIEKMRAEQLKRESEESAGLHALALKAAQE